MKFDENYVKDGLDDIYEKFKADYEMATITVSSDSDFFGEPDILDLMSFLSDSGNMQLCDKVTRQCVVGKTINFELDGDPIGSLRMNTVNDSWAVFPVFKEYPMAYKALTDTVTVYLLKKSLLPRKKGTVKPVAVQAVGTQS